MIFSKICVWEHHSIIPKIVFKEADPNGSCTSGPLGLTKPCLLINAAFGTNIAGWSNSILTSIFFLSSCWTTLGVLVRINFNFLSNFLSQTPVAPTQTNAMTKTLTQTEKNTTDVWTAQQIQRPSGPKVPIFPNHNKIPLIGKKLMYEQEVAL